jgi:hypothetical protein
MDGRLDKTATSIAPIQLKQLGGSVSLELPPIDQSFWKRLRRRKAAQLAWRRYILSKRLEALSRSPYDQDDREWDARIGRYL